MTALHIVRETALRSWLKTIRRPVPLTFSFVQPLFWVLIFGFLFHRFTLGPEYAGFSYLDFLLPGVCAMTVLFGASQAGIALVRDLQTGFLQRMVRSSMHPVWILTGKIVAEVTRLLLQAFVVGLLGIALGARLRIDPLALVVALVALARWNPLSLVANVLREALLFGQMPDAANLLPLLAIGAFLFALASRTIGKD